MSGAVELEGSGPTRVLVLPGWALDSSVWDASRSKTDQERFTYAYFDFPGYGRNRPSPPADGVDGMARAALAAAAQLNWDKFAVLGHSMGGTTALRVATLAPDKVNSVYALTPVSPGGTPLDAETYETFRSAYPSHGAILRQLAPHLTDDQLDDIVSRGGTTLDRSVWEAYLANWASASFADELGRYSAPTTLAVGASDPFVTAEYLADTLSRLQAGRLMTIEGAGHYPMIEQTEVTVSLWEGALS